MNLSYGTDPGLMTGSRAYSTLGGGRISFAGPRRNTGCGRSLSPVVARWPGWNGMMLLVPPLDGVSFSPLFMAHSPCGFEAAPDRLETMPGQRIAPDLRPPADTP